MPEDKVEKLVQAAKHRNDYKLEPGDLAREKGTGRLIVISDWSKHPDGRLIIKKLNEIYYLACKKHTMLNCTRAKGACHHCPERKDRLLP